MQTYVSSQKKKSRIILGFDQHAVDERIKLEALERHFFGTSGKERNFDVNDFAVDKAKRYFRLELAEHRLLDGFHHYAQRMGWKLSFSKTFLEIIQAPQILQTMLDKNDLFEYLEKVSNETDPEDVLPPAFRRILNSKACRSAIMFGDSLSLEECQILLNNLSLCASPFQCAHGRPSVSPVASLDPFY